MHSKKPLFIKERNYNYFIKEAFGYFLPEISFKIKHYMYISLLKARRMKSQTYCIFHSQGKGRLVGMLLMGENLYGRVTCNLHKGIL